VRFSLRRVRQTLDGTGAVGALPKKSQVSLAIRLKRHELAAIG